MMWIIASILVAVPSVTSACGGTITLSATNPETTFQTPNYPEPHSATESCSWVVSAPENVAELDMTCNLHTYGLARCSYTSFSFYKSDTKMTVCGTGAISRTVKGPTNTFTFKSSLWYNFYYKGVSCKVSYTPEDVIDTTTTATTTTTTTTTATITTKTPSVNPSCTCGQKVGQRIVGGNEVTANEYPWQALLMYKSTRSQFCGGSVIAREWVLSASHCTDGTTPSSILVVLGEHDYSKSDSLSRDFEVTQIIMHENYGQGINLNNDIALLKLANPITFNQAISPICLPFNYKNDDFTDKTGITSGWGLTIPGDRSSGSKVLKEINLKLIMSSKCDYNNGHGWAPSQVNENMICGKAEDGGSCQGDSGGPMFWKSPSSNLYVHLGIVSFGSTCASKVTPTVYAYVPKYVDWIVEKTGAGDEFCVRG